MKRLCGIGVALVVCLLCAFIGDSYAAEKRFSLVVREGFGSIGIGDLNNVLNSTNNDAVFEALRESYPQCCLGNIQEVPNNFKNWEVELQWNAVRRFSIGIAFEDRVRCQGKSSLTYTILGSIGTETINFNYDSRVSAYAPIKLNLYYGLPINSNVSFLLNVGAGYYYAKLSRNTLLFFHYPSSDLTATSSDQFDVKGHQVGFHCGFAFEYKVNARIALLAESHWRFVKIKTLTGSASASAQLYDGEGNLLEEGEGYEAHGTLLRYVGTNAYTRTRIDKLMATSLDPSSLIGLDDPSDVKKATLDLSGFTFRIGLKIGLF